MIRWIIKLGPNTAAAPHPSKATAALVFKSEEEAQEWVDHMGKGVVKKIQIKELD